MTSSTIVFDTETTGIHADTDEILEIGIVSGDGEVVLERRYKPQHTEAWDEAARVNGIWPTDVAGCPAITEDIDLLRDIFASADTIIGYNVEFDLKFLAAVGIGPAPGARIIDTVPEYAPIHGVWDERFDEWAWCKLTVAADEIGYVWTGVAHGAVADALATLAVQNHIDSKAE